MAFVIATPLTFAALLAAHTPMIQLSAGVYPAPAFLSQHADVTIRCGKGAKFQTSGDKYGVNIYKSSNIAFEYCAFDGGNRGTVIGLSSNIRFSYCEWLNFTSDAVDIANSQDVTIEYGVIHSARVDMTKVPMPHPDGVQIWNRPFDENTRIPFPTTARITVRHMTIVIFPGEGIAQTNHVRDYPAKPAKGFPALTGVDDGGADDVTVEDNDVWGGSRAASATAVRGLTFQRNHVHTLPQSPNQALYIYQGSTLKATGGNTMDAAPWLGKKAVHD